MKQNKFGKFIGVASMEKDGTIVLQLRTEIDGGANFVEGYYRYEPNNPNYKKILEHIGELKPGKSKNILPWPD